MILAVDPGATGAIAFVDPACLGIVSVADMPTVDGEVDVLALDRMVRAFPLTEAVIERVNAMPGGGERKMGATGAFKFGGTYSAARAVVALAGIPYRLITPAEWKRRFRLPGGPEGKEKAGAEALRRFPDCATSFARKKDHGRAEAALLALYGAETSRNRREVA